MNVLLISPFCGPNVGGAETHLEDLYNFISSQGHKVSVITYQPLTTLSMGKRHERRENLDIYRIQWFGHALFPRLERYLPLEFLYLTPGLLIGVILYLLKSRAHVDVLHAHGLNAALVASIAGKIFSKRKVVSIHAIYNFPEKPFLASMVRRIIGSFDKIIALADRSRRDLLTLGLSHDRVVAIDQWVDQKTFTVLGRSYCKELLGLEGKFVVLFVGRLIPKKGMSAIMKASTLVHSSVEFCIIGDGPMAEELKAFSEARCNLHFLGKVSRTTVVKYYNAADIVIVPSQYDEGFARVVLESLSCGTPVIVANRGCLPEMVDSSVGIVIEPTPENIACTISALWADKSKLHSLQGSCRTYAERRYSPNNGAQVLGTYS